MNRNEIQEYVDASRSILDSSPQMDEANTKAAILRDFLDVLGWDIPQNTQLEYSVQAFGQTYKVDYALVIDSTPLAFIEAKGVDTSLTTDHEEQLSSYMTNENVNYGILTNGAQYRFFQRRVDADDVSVQRVGNIQLQQLPTRLAVLQAYTCEAITSGEAENILRRINELRDARTTLEADKDALASELTAVLTDSVSDAIASLAESQSKELIDRLIQDIENEIDSDKAATGTRTATTDDGTSTIDPVTNHLSGSISRSELEGDGDARVAVFPTRKSGLPFLKENNAWGFVRVGREFDYVAMYVSDDVRAVQYVARVKDVVSPDDAELVRPPEEYVDRAKIAEDKKVVRFEENSLYELEDPVPYESAYPQSLRYTTLGALRTAETTDDIL